MNDLNQNTPFISENPGRDCQKVGTAKFLGQDPLKVHAPVWTVIGNQGDSQCYIGVTDKVAAVQEAMSKRIVQENLDIRLIAPNFAGGVSDGQLNGTSQMRFSLIGREVTHDAACLHLSGSEAKGIVAVVACDKPPVGTLAALLEHNEPAIMMSDGSIKPGIDPQTEERIDLVSCFQVAGDADGEKKARYAMNACPGTGSCGGMFTYNTMQSFFGALGMEPLHMVAPASQDPRRMQQFPDELVEYLLVMTRKNIRPKDIITRVSLRNAITVAIAMGGSTNVVLHAPEIARAAGLDFWNEVITQQEFNELSRTTPVLINARPFGRYSMVDIEAKGGLPVIVKELLQAGLLDGSCITCTGETLQEQINRLNPAAPDGDVIHSMTIPFKPTGGLRMLSGNLAPEGGAVIKVAGVEGGMKDGIFTGKAQVFNSEAAVLEALTHTPEIFQDKDMVVIRYAGPQGAPGMPEMLDPTSRITTLCRQKNITIALMTDARFSGGSVGLVIGHVTPEAYLGGPIALVENGDTITVDLNTDSIDCAELHDSDTHTQRFHQWQQAVKENGGIHPHAAKVENRLLKRMRATARPALQGAGI
ncbi:dihydroxy-acid dehydratase [Dictyobacter alpinus]|uniref:Dihydroxy-acid dehydratase n=1 Tax=Dictyobacter alpinus TaxID=2014873 RepID=A0A402BD47_9CHLR|nr:dihydroxy-acid dehydratase [Dictyobacter alpinus]GCE29285.1 dihydroxy-acid dehydratase [Dictyobacter alpinus]